MIHELSAHPKPTNNKAKITFYVFLALFVFGVVAYLVMHYYLEIAYSGFIGLVPLVSVTVAVFFYNKYIGTRYCYDITFDCDRTALFVVRQVTGKRFSTLCRVALYEIMKVERETPETRRAHKTPLDHRKYNYIPTFMPDVTYRLVTRSRYERSEIVIECSDEFANTLRAYIAEARQISIQQEAEEEY